MEITCICWREEDKTAPMLHWNILLLLLLCHSLQEGHHVVMMLMIVPGQFSDCLNHAMHQCDFFLMLIVAMAVLEVLKTRGLILTLTHQQGSFGWEWVRQWDERRWSTSFTSYLIGNDGIQLTIITCIAILVKVMQVMIARLIILAKIHPRLDQSTKILHPYGGG